MINWDNSGDIPLPPGSGGMPSMPRLGVRSRFAPGSAASGVTASGTPDMAVAMPDQSGVGEPRESARHRAERAAATALQPSALAPGVGGQPMDAFQQWAAALPQQPPIRQPASAFYSGPQVQAAPMQQTTYQQPRPQQMLARPQQMLARPQAAPRPLTRPATPQTTPAKKRNTRLLLALVAIGILIFVANPVLGFVLLFFGAVIYMASHASGNSSRRR